MNDIRNDYFKQFVITLMPDTWGSCVMRMKLIHELSEIWRQAENSLLVQDDKKALQLKYKFINKCKNLKEDEIEELSKILDGDAC